MLPPFRSFAVSDPFRGAALWAMLLFGVAITGCDDPVEPEPELSVATANLSFEVSKSAEAPTPAIVAIENQGTGTLEWTASANASWLRLDPASGTAPSELTVSVNPLLAPLGQHTATLTIVTPDGAEQQIEVAIAVQTDPSSSLIISRSFDNGPIQLHRVDLESGTSQQLTEGSHTLPDVAPTGDRVVFRRSDNGSVISLMEIEGNGFMDLIAGQTPSWSPDGQQIAFGGTNGVEVINPDGTGARTIGVADFYAYGLDWSPDGTKIAFSGGLAGPADLYVLDVESGDTLNLTSTTYRSDLWPNWSPDGEWIVFRSVESEDAAPQLYLIRPDGRDRTRIEGLPPGVHYYGTWSPDGTRLAFTRPDQHELPAGIWIAEMQGTEAVSVEWLIDGSHPAWIPQ